MKKVLIVGTGLMAGEYFKTLKGLDCDITVVGRSEHNALRFYNDFKIRPFVGGIREFFQKEKKKFDYTIIAVGVDQLAEVSIVCLENECRKLLIEKPGGLSFEEIRQLGRVAAGYDSEIFIAYNRRFYSSVYEAIQMAKNDGGILSGSFEFTEWGHVIKGLPVSDLIKSNYFLANSSHVFDLAFYIFGTPKLLHAFSKGDVGWHKPSVYSGSGITESGVLFNYSANWESAGRWGVEICTAERKLILRPMEKLFEQRRGELEIREVTVSDSEFDVEFKPGLYKQVRAFISNASQDLKSLHTHISDLEWMEVMLNGGDFIRN